MKALVLAGVVWCVLLLATISAARGAQLDMWQAVGLFWPVSLLWGVWACGYLLAVRRRSSVLSALSRLSGRLQRMARRG